MEKNKKKCEGKSISTMPPVMHDELKERQVRETIYRLQESVINQVRTLRSFGMEINTADDLKQITPDFVKKGISEQKAKQINGSFIPVAIRRQWEREFSKMEAQLLPAAENLQETLKSVKWPIVMDDDPEQVLYFDSNAVEEYIKKQASVKIPNKLREFYAHVELICNQWNDIQTWCTANGIMPLTMGVIRSLTNEGRYEGVPSALSAHEVCTLTVNPDAMFRWWQYGIVKMQPTTASKE